MWVAIATITLSEDWQFTSSVAGVWFRVHHALEPTDFRRGLIAQASLSNPVDLFGIKRLYSKPEYDLLQLIQPDCLSDRAIAIKGRWLSSDVPWVVNISVWNQGETNTLKLDLDRIESKIDNLSS